MAFQINNNQIPVDKYQEGHICGAFFFFKGTVNVKPLAAKLRQSVERNSICLPN